MASFNFNGSNFTAKTVIWGCIRISVAAVVSYYSVKWMMNQIDPTSKKKKDARKRAEEQFAKLIENHNFKSDIKNFSEYELMIASHLVAPEDITVSWSDIAGLDSTVGELLNSVVMPVRHREKFPQSKLWRAPMGILLHGPPGCGKTLIAKATAKEAAMRFINLDVAMLTDKWYGESQKLASAVFSLALKIEPCIIFIDEMDSFLRSRSSNDHEATAMMKTQFMMLWDGLTSNGSATVIVMGATNRPQDLDKAILRRMPAQFHIGLPSREQRMQILRLILKTESVPEDMDYKHLAEITSNFSGSDLLEMCRTASVGRMRQYIKDREEIQTQAAEMIGPPISVTMDDLVKTCNKMKESKVHTNTLGFESGIELNE